MEETYVNRNGAATLKLGYARGVALLAPALAGITVVEYGALAVKKAVVGTGGASKDQVGMMVRRLLPGALLRRADAADALAVAICHAHHRATGLRLATRGANGVSSAATNGPARRQMTERCGSVIAQLTGLLGGVEEGRAVIDVQGVGYLVHASTRTLAALPAPPSVARVLVETQVREEAITLYGFADPAERDWFRLLTTVQGVGGAGGARHPLRAGAARPGGRHRRR